MTQIGYVFFIDPPYTLPYTLGYVGIFQPTIYI
nr:MAG TPA: DNA adenine methylase [Caudoviricetes sp.]DAJ03409.1 MAG TPA: DNA adenine methylase [Caudoviricetes sp.]